MLRYLLQGSDEAMKEKILRFINSIGIEKCGIAPYDNDFCAIVCLFPYFSGYKEGNLSVYTYSEDYHLIIKDKLALICDYLHSIAPDCRCESFADIGPEIDRLLAYEAGLGFYGKNHMLINDDFGSYFFIGYIKCSLKLERDAPLDKTCLSCNECIKHCPGGALGTTFDINRCASHISQKKGELSPEEKSILKKSGLVFGCDQCQRVCPHNKALKPPMKEFCQNIKESISKSELEALSGRKFVEKYKNRAFSWRGKNVLLRNINIIEGTERK